MLPLPCQGMENRKWQEGCLINWGTLMRKLSLVNEKSKGSPVSQYEYHESPGLSGFIFCDCESFCAVACDKWVPNRDSSKNRILVSCSSHNLQIHKLRLVIKKHKTNKTKNPPTKQVYYYYSPSKLNGRGKKKKNTATLHWAASDNQRRTQRLIAVMH